jgi:hypothetical protein
MDTVHAVRALYGFYQVDRDLLRGLGREKMDEGRVAPYSRDVSSVAGKLLANYLWELRASD